MKHKFYIFGLVFLAFLFSSCEEGPSGIFYRVAHEKPLYENQTKDLENSSPSFVARQGSKNYLGAGRLWVKADGATIWTTAGVPGAVGSSYYAISGVSDNNNLYVLFKDKNAGDLGVYSYNGSWTSIGLPAGESAQKLLSANNQVFLVTLKDSKYSIYSLSGNSFNNTAISSDLSGFPNSVAFDNSVYWFAAGKELLTGTSSLIPSPNSPTASFGGIAASGSSLVLSTKSGKLYASTDGNNWALKDVADELSFTAPVFYDNNKLLVGTDVLPRSSTDRPKPSGYKEFSLSGTTLTEIVSDSSGITDGINFSSSLDNKIVSSIECIDMGSSKKILYALTYGDGLWSNTYDGGSWGQWLRE